MALPPIPGSLSTAVQTLQGEAPSVLADILGPLKTLLANWRDDTRLYRLESADANWALPGGLMVESFVRTDRLSSPFWMCVNCVSLSAHLELKKLYARPLTLVTRLADGGEHRVSGYVMEAINMGGNGGLARYSLVMRPWIALPRHTLDSNGWCDKSVIDMVEAIFADHPTIAAWKWDDKVPDHVRQGLFASRGGQRNYCAQYRESDLDFISRLLAEEGIAWRVEESDEAPGRHQIVFFVDSHQQPEDPTSSSSLGGAGIRFHASSSQEAQDSIQAFAALRTVGVTGTALQAWNYIGNSAVAAEVPTCHDWGGDEAQSLQGWLTSYDPTGAYLMDDQGAAQFMATRLQEAREARLKTWHGQGTVRTLRPGTWFALTQSTLDPLSVFGQQDEDRQFFVTATVNIGINNMPRELNEAVARQLGETLRDVLAETSEGIRAGEGEGEGGDGKDLDCAPLIERASQTGYACRFEAIRRDIPWRPVLLDGTGLRPRPRPTALGVQTAIVVGPNDETTPSGADELYTDALGRIKVRFQWQSDEAMGGRSGRKQASRHSCWIRVVQSLSGPGMGHQFIPRIGMEVLVAFINNDIDMPVAIKALYNGRGEGGVPRTPGGRAAERDTSAFAESNDHQTSAQMNLVGAGSGGHSPAWHGAAPGATSEGNEGQNNAAALSGVKSKEFGGPGYNQLVMDDTPGQGRLQLHSTQSQTWLQMGHLLHQADNHRGSFRGLGFELRTDAWGGLRAARGVMLSTFGLDNGLGQSATPAGDNAPGMALARQAQQLAGTFHQAATTHQTVGLATAAGSEGAGQSALDDQLAPAAALTKSLSGMVSTASLPDAQADAQDKATSTGQGKVPHMADPNIALTGKAGVGLTAGQDLHLSALDTAQIASGQDTHFAVGGQMRVQTGQAIGVLAGAIQPGGEGAGKGLAVIAAQGAIDMQAQAGPAQLAAKDTLEIKTASGVINIAAAKRIVLAVSGGAGITIEGGQLTVQCPGKITVKAGQKSMIGGATESWAMPQMPRSSLPDAQPVRFNLRTTDVAGPLGAGMPHKPWRIVRAVDERTSLTVDDSILAGKADDQGVVKLTADQEQTLALHYNQHPNELWFIHGHKVKALALTIQRDDWTEQQKRDHALDAMGYSDTLGPTGDITRDKLRDALARDEHKTGQADALLGKLKG